MCSTEVSTTCSMGKVQFYVYVLKQIKIGPFLNEILGCYRTLAGYTYFCHVHFKGFAIFVGRKVE